MDTHGRKSLISISFFLSYGGPLIVDHLFERHCCQERNRKLRFFLFVKIMGKYGDIWEKSACLDFKGKPLRHFHFCPSVFSCLVGVNF